MLAFIFPGQGSQNKGMGGDLFKQFPKIVEKADKILGYSIYDFCVNDPYNQIDNTFYTQPALYTVNALYWYKYKQENPHMIPRFLLGHSLGEYNALMAAGVFDFETGLKIVQERAKLMSKVNEEGSMAAILGITSKETLEIINANNFDKIYIANYNTHTNTVISGSKTQIEKSEQIFEEAEATFVPLKVSGAFHSKYMKDARKNFKKFLQSFDFNPPSIPVISNVNVKPHRRKEIASYLAQHITCPVKWVQSIEYLREEGITDFIELGHGDTLSRLIKRILKGS